MSRAEGEVAGPEGYQRSTEGMSMKHAAIEIDYPEAMTEYLRSADSSGEEVDQAGGSGNAQEAVDRTEDGSCWCM